MKILQFSKFYKNLNVAFNISLVEQINRLLYHWHSSQNYTKVNIFLGSSDNRAVNRQPSFRTEDSYSASTSHTILIFSSGNLRFSYFLNACFWKLSFFRNLPVKWNAMDLALACRAGGKPSTRFPPETRRAEPTSTYHHQ